jgi:hypothetical protein
MALAVSSDSPPMYGQPRAAERDDERASRYTCVSALPSWVQNGHTQVILITEIVLGLR